MALTRRALLLTAPFLAVASDALARASDDRQIVTAAIDLEQRAAAIYDAAAADARVPRELRALARHLGEHEREHADGLARALRGLGGRRPAPPVNPPRTPSGAEFGPFAIELENHLVAAYYDAMPRLRPGLRQPLGSIMACEGQHLVVLRQALGRDPLPEAFENGGHTR